MTGKPRGARSNAATSPRRLLRREGAALYCGMSPSKWDQVTDSGEWPAAHRIGRCKLWDMRVLDQKIDEIFGGVGAGFSLAGDPNLDDEAESSVDWTDVAV